LKACSHFNLAVRRSEAQDFSRRVDVCPEEGFYVFSVTPEIQVVAGSTIPRGEYIYRGMWRKSQLDHYNHYHHYDHDNSEQLSDDSSRNHFVDGIKQRVSGADCRESSECRVGNGFR
jgi:hypothetical protein